MQRINQRTAEMAAQQRVDEFENSVVALYLLPVILPTLWLLCLWLWQVYSLADSFVSSIWCFLLVYPYVLIQYYWRRQVVRKLKLEHDTELMVILRKKKII
tara:strand:- start:115 stop:417 length:303 start_codon:yes stop_codon:yes gene_type:complete